MTGNAWALSAARVSDRHGFGTFSPLSFQAFAFGA
jgi:hypothetical protein